MVSALRRAVSITWRAPRMEESMRSLGMAFLTGAVAIVLWKVLAALFIGMLGWVLKVGLVILAVYFILKIINGKKKDD